MKIAPFCALALAAPGCLLGCGEEFQTGGTGDGAGRLEVAIARPTKAALDPLQDPRASLLRVSVRQPGSSDGPSVELAPPADDLVVLEDVPYGTKDVVVEVLASGDARAVGLGVRFDETLKRGQRVTVDVRKRLLYVADAGGGDPGAVPRAVQALDLAAEGSPEPATDLGLVEHLLGLDDATGVFTTRTGTEVVVSALEAGTSNPLLSVIATSDHAELRRVALPWATTRLAPVGDGRAITAPDDGPAALLLIDAVAGTASPLPLGTGSGFRAASAVASADGKSVAVVGRVQLSNQWQPRALVIDVETAFGGGSGAVKAIDPQAIDQLTDARFSADGSSLWLAGYVDIDPNAGVLLEYERTALGFVRQIDVGTDRGRVSSLILHPDGEHAYLYAEYQYPGQVREGMLIVSLSQGKVVMSDDQYGPACAAREYFGRILAGQSHFANDRTGELVDITAGGAKPGPMAVPDYAGSYAQLAIPFGTQL